MEKPPALAGWQSREDNHEIWIRTRRRRDIDVLRVRYGAAHDIDHNNDNGDNSDNRAHSCSANARHDYDHHHSHNHQHDKFDTQHYGEWRTFLSHPSCRGRSLPVFEGANPRRHCG